MKERPYHHLPDGTFRNPKGSPVIISRSGKFSYRTFSKLRKKVNLSYPKEHVIEKEKVLADLEKYKDNDYIAWICLLYTSPSPRDRVLSRMPSSA